VNSGLKQMWKENVVASFEILSQHVPGGAEENNSKTSVRIICVPREVRTG
jgi:hypothetical protein